MVEKISMSGNDIDDRLVKAEWVAIPPATSSKTITGSAAVVRLGISKEFGGVGVNFELASRSSDGNSGPFINILEARSAAGCGWQTSFLLRDQSRRQTIVFNQAAGNSVPYQWGYQNDYHELAAFHWNPVVSDHIHPGHDFSRSVATSPFDGSGYLLDDGRLHIGTSTIAAGAGIAVDITNQYTLRSRHAQSWQWWAAEQALYLNKKVAREHDLRVFLCGSSRRWFEGPIRPYDNYVVHHGCSSCDDKQCFSTTDALSFVLLIWEVHGQDIAIAVIPSKETSYGHLNMNRMVYGQDSTDDRNGSIDWHTIVELLEPAHFQKNAERAYQVRYIVGTPAQLAILGYRAS